MGKWRYRWLVITRGVAMANAWRALENFEKRHCRMPAFEVRDGGKVYRVYENGATEGFGPGAVVVNRIPLIRAGA
jgi:hypothetical protein